MTSREPARDPAGRTRSVILAVVGAVLAGVATALVVHDGSEPTAAGLHSGRPATTEAPATGDPGPRTGQSARPRPPGRRDREEPPAPPGAADGDVPEGVTVFDDEFPAVSKLDSALLDALRRAATDAGDDGVGFVVNSGWRSPVFQERLLQEAISKYGSEEEAAKWVATPETSPHVSGDAVDIGPTDASAWLSQHGAAYGLCQIYGNEPWHYELRSGAADDGCPAMYTDPTQDPRMRR
jgi:D-alanyl-D-alanine carboxypeptidase